MMQTGYVKISIEGKTPSIEMQLVNGNLWMSRWGIAQLFGCFSQKIEMNLKSIFKSRLLREENVSYTYEYIDKGIEKQCTYFNLEVLIFLSYRIGTLEAQIFRQFVNSSLREHLQRKEVEKCTEFLWSFRKSQDYRLN